MLLVMEIIGIVDRILRNDDRQVTFFLKHESRTSKITDQKCTLDGIRVGDTLRLEVKPVQGSPNDCIFNELLSFNRPFSPQQIVQMLHETKFVGQKAVDSLVDGNKLEPLIAMMRKGDWDSVATIVGKGGKSSQIIGQLKNYCREINNFLFLAVNRILLSCDRCKMDDNQWQRSQKIFNEMLKSGKIDADLVIKYLESSPYSLISQHLIKATTKNFQLIDLIAKNGPFGPNWSEELHPRQLMGLWCTLRDHTKQTGNCFMKLDTLTRQTKVMLNRLVPKIVSKLNTVSLYKIHCNDEETSIVYPKYVDDTERAVCQKLKEMLFDTDMTRINIENADVLSIDPHLDETQISIVCKVINNPVAIITGPPGVGKTRIVSVIIKLLKRYAGSDTLISAPTGMACKNIAKALSLNTGEDRSTVSQETSTVYTIAKLLYSSDRHVGATSDSSGASGGAPTVDDSDSYGGGGDSDSDSDGDCHVDPLGAAQISKGGAKVVCLLDEIVQGYCGIVIDETSMVDICQFNKLLSHLPKKDFRLILVGDHNQLPSIKMGQVLLDLINSQVIPVYHLQTNYRQQTSGSRICINAANILSGNSELKDGSDFTYIASYNDQETVDTLCDLLGKLKQKCSLDDCVILTAFSEKGSLCSKNLNHLVKGLFIEDRSVSWSNMAVGDRVMQTKNIHKRQLVNGDIGIIKSMTFDQRIMKHLTVEFFGTNSGLTKYDKNDAFHYLQLAYAISIHKSQGSGYPYVILVIPSQYNSVFLNRNMIYTAITRAKKHLFVIGGDMSNAIETPPVERSTRLAVRLKKSVDSQTKI